MGHFPSILSYLLNACNVAINTLTLDLEQLRMNYLNANAVILAHYIRWMRGRRADSHTRPFQKSVCQHFLTFTASYCISTSLFLGYCASACGLKFLL